MALAITTDWRGAIAMQADVSEEEEVRLVFAANCQVDVVIHDGAETNM